MKVLVDVEVDVLLLVAVYVEVLDEVDVPVYVKYWCLSLLMSQFLWRFKFMRWYWSMFCAGRC